MLSGHWGDQMLFSTAYLIDLLRARRMAIDLATHRRNTRAISAIEETAMRRRLLLLDAVRYHVPRAVAPPLKWLRLARVRAATTEAHGFRRPFSQPRCATVIASPHSSARFHSAHAQAVYIEARSKYHVQCMEWNAKVAALSWARRGLSFSRSRPDRHF